MPLHRDIYWVGRQWAVTGYGMQAIDQKLNGMFDIEVSRLWEDGLSERMYGLKWINMLDFDKGLAAARKRYPEPSQKPAPPDAAVSSPKDGNSIDQVKQAPILDTQIHGGSAKARFVALWRVHRPR
jgi:hypothetical protein